MTSLAQEYDAVERIDCRLDKIHRINEHRILSQTIDDEITKLAYLRYCCMTRIAVLIRFDQMESDNL